MRQLYPSSPKALDKPVRGIREAKYPWKEIQVGQSFSIGHDEIKLESLRPFVSRMAKKFGKKFRVIDHGAEAGYEVSCQPFVEAGKELTAEQLIKTAEAQGKSVWQLPKGHIPGDI